MPLVRAATLGEAAPIEGRPVSWLFAAEPPREAEEFFTAFAAVESFSGFGVSEVASNLARWLGAAGRVHPFRPLRPMHLAEHFLDCVGAAKTAAQISRVRLSLPGDAVRAAHSRLATVPRPILAVQPGSGSKAKRWSRAGFVEVVSRWRERGAGVVIALGPAEADELSLWRDEGRVLVQPDLLELSALLGACDGYLGNDSGVSHLAAASGARGAAIFGPTDPALWRPLSDRIVSHRLLRWSECGEAAPPNSVDAVDRALALAMTLP